MNKTTLIIFTITLLFIGLIGCGTTRTEVKQSSQIELDAQNIVSINLIEEDQPVTTISEASSLERFVQAITAAEYDKGQLDIAPSDYRTTVNMKDGISYEFSFWIVGSNSGLLIKSGQTGHYRLSDISKKICWTYSNRLLKKIRFLQQTLLTHSPLTFKLLLVVNSLMPFKALIAGMTMAKASV